MLKPVELRLWREENAALAGAAARAPYAQVRVAFTLKLARATTMGVDTAQMAAIFKMLLWIRKGFEKLE